MEKGRLSFNLKDHEPDRKLSISQGTNFPSTRSFDKFVVHNEDSTVKLLNDSIRRSISKHVDESQKFSSNPNFSKLSELRKTDQEFSCKEAEKKVVFTMINKIEGVSTSDRNTLDQQNLYDETALACSLDQKVKDRNINDSDADLTKKNDEAFEDIVFPGLLILKSKSHLVTSVGKSDLIGIDKAIQEVRLIKEKSLGLSTMSILCSEQTPKGQKDNSLWPWPWLNPSLSVNDIYKTKENTKVILEMDKIREKITVPSLSNSLIRYLESIKPLARASVFESIRKEVKKFASTEGPTLQRYLKYLQEASSKCWFDASLLNHRFLSSRLELPLMNRAVVAPFTYDLWPPCNGSQIERSAQLIKMVMEFWYLLRKEEVSQIFYKRQKPICMNQFLKLFSSVRIPGKINDEVKCYFKTEREGKCPCHVVVLYKSHIFKVNVIDGNGLPLKESKIKVALESIIACVEEGDLKTPSGISILTSATRSDWFQQRQKLISLCDENRSNLQEIEESILILSLDHMNARCSDDILREAIFGDGFGRWYDKSLTFYVYANGVVTLNVNESIVDLFFVNILLNFVHLKILEDAEKWDLDIVKSMSNIGKFVLSNPDISTSAGIDQVFENIRFRIDAISSETNQTLHLKSKQRVQYLLSAKVLSFKTNEEITQEIDTAQVRFAALSNMIETAICVYEKFPRNFFKENKIHTDAFIHLALHLTVYRMYHKFAPIGSKVEIKQSMTTDYDWFRTITNEIVHWVKAMEQSADEGTKLTLFWAAIKKHKELLSECELGNGFDNHLTALRAIAGYFDEKYCSDMFMNENCLVTDGTPNFFILAESIASRSPSSAVVISPHFTSYGIGYSLVNTRIIFCVSSWKEELTTDAHLFAYTLQWALEYIYTFLIKHFQPNNY